MSESRPKGRPKLREIEVSPDDLEAVLEMSIESIKMNRSPKFTEDAQGLEEFKQASIDYLEYVRKVNNNPDNENHLVPDIESWATYLGTTRATIFNYEKNRGEEWREFIALIKGAITAAKKQLAFRQKIPTVLALFDLTNNSGYVNSNQFTLTTEQDDRREIVASELPTLNQSQPLPVIEDKGGNI